VPEKGASIALTAGASSETSTLVPGSTFQHEYSLGRLGTPLHRSYRCVSRSLFGGAGGGLKPGAGARSPACPRATAAGEKQAGEEEGKLSLQLPPPPPPPPQKEEGAAEEAEGFAGPSVRARAAPELELLPSTNRALNQAMAAAAQQVVMCVLCPMS
jgi:hypothetical protein